MSLNLIAMGSPYWRMLRGMTMRSVEYVRHGGATATITAHVIGAKADGMFAAAQQQDVQAEMDAREFRTAFGADAVPGKFDRIRTMGRSYTVEETKGRPNDNDPEQFSVLLRGG